MDHPQRILRIRTQGIGAQVDVFLDGSHFFVLSQETIKPPRAVTRVRFAPAGGGSPWLNRVLTARKNLATTGHY